MVDADMYRGPRRPHLPAILMIYQLLAPEAITNGSWHALWL